MSKDVSARKRRRVEATETSTRSEETGGAVVFDDEAMKRHMLSLLQHSKDHSAEEGSESEDDGEGEGKGSGDEDDSQVETEESDGEDEDSTLHGNVGTNGTRSAGHLDSDEEDLDETARALLTGHKPTNGNAEYDAQTASRISRIPTDRIAIATPKKAALKTTFESLGLSVQLIRTLAGISIRKPTEIQSACFEPILNGASPRNVRCRSSHLECVLQVGTALAVRKLVAVKPWRLPCLFCSVSQRIRLESLQLC